MDPGRLFSVLGLQFGSEGKGAVTSYLAPLMDIGVRTGAANAGHTIYHRDKRFVMRQLPSVWINPRAKLIIGRGALVSPEVLIRETRMLSRYDRDIKSRIYIDKNAHVIADVHIEREAKGDLAERIGSTSARSREGIGAATAAKVLREEECTLAKDEHRLWGFRMVDTVELVNETLERGGYVLAEGTQGFGLSLEHGEFPFVTSRSTTTMALADSIGVNPGAFECDTIGVARTFPIRVAGNSGPFDADSREVDWDFVAKEAKAKHRIVERTSVTGMVRRVATWSDKGFVRACRVNRPTEIALTFADYLDWSIHGKDHISDRVEVFSEHLERISGISVTIFGTGPKTIVDCDHYRRNILRRIG